MASKYWIKLYHEILDDHKMGMLSDRLYRRVIELFLIAGECDLDGVLPDLDAMAWRLRLSPGELDLDLQELRKSNIVTLQSGKWIVTNFAERQAPVSDAERMQRLRDRKQKEQYYGDGAVTNDVTYRNVDTYTDTYTESDTDIKGVKRPPLLIAFEAVTKIYQPAEMLEPKGFMLWEKEINKWEGMGVTKADIEAAVEKADELKTNLSWPGSITKYMASAIARRKRGVNGGAKQAQDATDLIMQMVEKGEI